MRRLALIAVLIAFASPAAAGAVSSSRHRGVLQGVVTHGPACIGQGPCGEPIPDVKIVFHRNGHSVQTTTTATGQYRIRLHSGLYGIQLPGRNQWQPTQARVLRGQVTHLNIAIDDLTG